MLERFRHALPHLVMLGVSLALYVAATKIDTGGAGGRIGPDFWPKLIIGLMAALCAYEAAKRLLFNRGSAHGLGSVLTAQPAAVSETAATPSEAGPAEPEREYPAVLALGTALVIGYVLAVTWLGFFLTTALFLAGFAWIGGFRRPLMNLVIGLVGALLLVVLFMRVAYISLPLGEGPFRSLSLGLLDVLGVK